MRRRRRAAALVWLPMLGMVLLARWGESREARWLAERTAVAVAGYLSLVVPRERGGFDFDPFLLLSAAARLGGRGDGVVRASMYRGPTLLVHGHPTAPQRLEDALYRRLRTTDAPARLGGLALAPLKDPDDWETVGAVAVEVEPTPSPGAVLVAALLAGLFAAAAATAPSAGRRELGLVIAVTVLLAGLAYREVRASARASTDRWLVETQRLIELAARAPRRPAVAGFARIVRGARLEVSEVGSRASPAREAVDGLPAATAVAALPRSGTVRIATVPREATLGALLAGLAFLAIAAGGVAALARTAFDAARPAAARRRAGTAWAFLAPAGLHLVVFSLVPILFAGWLSVHRWDLLQPVKPFVGLENYLGLARDPLFWRSLLNTMLYSLYVPATAVLALALALAVERRGATSTVLRALLFLPYVSSVVAVAIVWQWMYHPDVGLVNYALSLVGLGTVDWLGNPRTALVALMMVAAWIHLGYQTIIFVAGLHGIPSHYLDAARVDGASPWQRLRHVTLPLLRPVTLFVVVTGVIGSFQVFTLVYVMTEGNPLHATDVLVYRIYQLAWEFLRFGSASALSLVLAAVLVGATWLQFRLLARRVEYV